mmetsp:Transcript_4221/g.11900  ORF Transcript_4221/g.11900 Transcript_4221/m.11900 type:complete len:126 (+) Transcript_4221:298-675(+)
MAQFASAWLHAQVPADGGRDSRGLSRVSSVSSSDTSVEQLYFEMISTPSQSKRAALASSSAEQLSLVELQRAQLTRQLAIQQATRRRRTLREQMANAALQAKTALPQPQADGGMLLPRNLFHFEH